MNEDFETHPIDDIRENSTSLKTIFKRSFEREEILADTLNYFEELIGQSFEDVLIEYRKFDLLCGNSIVVMPKKKESFERYFAKALNIDSDGCLVIQTEDGEEISLVHEEVSIRPNKEGSN